MNWRPSQQWLRANIVSAIGFVLLLDWLSRYKYFQFTWGLEPFDANGKARAFDSMFRVLSEQSGISTTHLISACWWFGLILISTLFFKKTAVWGAFLVWLFFNFVFWQKRWLFYGLHMYTQVFLLLWLVTRPVKDESWTLFWGKLFLCLTYFNAGYAKILSPEWRDGTFPLGLAHEFFARYDLHIQATALHLPTLSMAWILILMQVFAPLIIIKRRLALPWMAFDIAVHLMIAITLQLYLFSILMILLNLVFIPPVDD